MVRLEQGFSLLELLIALFILTFVLLGIAGLALEALKRAENSFWQELATTQAILLREQQRVNAIIVFPTEFARLLPEGRVEVGGAQIKICWRDKYRKQCYVLAR